MQLASEKAQSKSTCEQEFIDWTWDVLRGLRRLGFSAARDETQQLGIRK